MSSRKRQLVFVAFFLLAIHTAIFAQSGGNERWVGTWSTSEGGRPQTPPPPAPALPPFQTNQCPAAPPAAPTFMHFNNQTLRQIVHTSIGGPVVRVVLSNVYGNAPLTIGAAHVALRDKDSSIQTASGRPLTFGGRPTVAIPAHAAVYSDAVNLTVPEMANLANVSQTARRLCECRGGRGVMDEWLVAFAAGEPGDSVLMLGSRLVRWKVVRCGRLFTSQSGDGGVR